MAHRRLSLALKDHAASKFVVFLILAILPCSTEAVSDDEAEIPVVDRWPAGQVLELTEPTLTEAIFRFKYVLVEFYSQKCTYCNALAPELAMAARDLALHSPPVVVGKVDVEKHPKLASKYKIDKLPTLKVFTEGVAAPYTGPREANALVPFMKRQLAPDVELLETEEGVKEYLATHKGDGLGVFLGFGLEPESVQELAGKYKDRAWFAVHPGVSDALMFAHDFDKGPALLAIHGHGEQEVYYGPFDGGAELKEFVHLNYLPPITILDENTFSRVAYSGRPIVLIAANFDSQAPKSLAMDAPDPKKVDSPAGEAVRFARRCKPVARRHRQYLFAYVDASKFQSFLASFRIDASTTLPAILVWNGGTQYYAHENPEKLRGEDMEFALSHFLQDIDAKKLVALRVKDPTLVEQAWNAVASPNFPVVLGLILVAICAKIGKKGENVFFPKLGFVAMKRKRDLEVMEERRRKAEGDVQAASEEQRGGGSDEQAGEDKAEEDKKND